MAAKKKTKNSKKTKKRSAKKSTTSKKQLQKRKPARKSTKKVALKKAAPKRKSAPKKKAVAKKKVSRRPSSASSEPFLREPRRARSGEQSGDLQGLSRRESAGSESVDELLGEGNAFEAEAVQGVEDAGDNAESEARTHEVSEDDVPEEYLDKD